MLPERVAVSRVYLWILTFGKVVDVDPCISGLGKLLIVNQLHKKAPSLMFGRISQNGAHCTKKEVFY